MGKQWKQGQIQGNTGAIPSHPSLQPSEETDQPTSSAARCACSDDGVSASVDEIYELNKCHGSALMKSSDCLSLMSETRFLVVFLGSHSECYTIASCGHLGTGVFSHDETTNVVPGKRSRYGVRIVRSLATAARRWRGTTSQTAYGVQAPSLLINRALFANTKMPSGESAAPVASYGSMSSRGVPNGHRAGLPMYVLIGERVSTQVRPPSPQ